jgi:hypothetical protein
MELLRYSATPGRLATPPLRWPANALIRPKPGRPTVLVFAHPQCPCTDATMGELSVIMARARGGVDAYVLLYAPRTESSQFTQTRLMRDAESIPGVHPIEDADGAESSRFGASTSGQTLLYDAHGALLFNGGITASRGHSGGNYGIDAILSLLDTGTAARRTAPVFGCSLLGEE